jgi:hypothetical protein
MSRKIEIAFDEDELVILYTVMETRCRRSDIQPGNIRLAILDKLAASLRALQSVPGRKSERPDT